LDGSSGVRTTPSRTRTTRTPRRAQLAFATACLAIPMSGLLGGTALAASDGPSAHASDRAATAAEKPAGFIGPVAPAIKWKAATPEATPYTNTGGVTVGANTTSYETVADGKGSTFTGVGGGQPSGDITAPQPLSTADQNNTGANDTSSTNPYASTRDGAPSLNGNGGGQQVGQPCAGCVGKADNKNPKGQAPNATDGNAGYECDRNHGIGRSNPAHTACTANPTTPQYDCKGHLLPNDHTAAECNSTTPSYDCKGHLLPNDHTAAECNSTTPSYDCKGHLLPNDHTAAECNSTNPAFDCKGHLLPNDHTAAECSSTNPAFDCAGHQMPTDHGVAECITTASSYDCMGHLLPNDHTAAECAGGGGGGGGGGQLCPNGTPMPASGNVADCNPPVVCPAGSMSSGTVGCGVSGGGGGPATTPVSGRTDSPATIVTSAGGTNGPGTALPFTGDSTRLLGASAALMLLVGAGLMIATRKPRPALALV
jgi:hypothetical protein